MIPISKDEAMQLRASGFYCPMTNRHKHSKQKNYYAVEEPQVLKKLDKYRESLQIKN